jgi:hypothetical protein
MTKRVELRVGEVLVARIWEGEPGRPGAKAVGQFTVRATSTGLEKVGNVDAVEALIDVSKRDREGFAKFIGRKPQTDRFIEDNAEELARERASEVFHAEPSRPGDCETYRKHFRRSCPCENDWRRYIGKEKP